MKSKPKQIEIKVNFNDVSDLKNTFDEILGLIKKGCESKDKSDYQYKMKIIPKQRFEIVNGSECLVIESKLNYA